MHLFHRTDRKTEEIINSPGFPDASKFVPSFYFFSRLKGRMTEGEKERWGRESLAVPAHFATHVIVSTSASHVKVIAALAQGVLKLLDQLRLLADL